MAEPAIKSSRIVVPEKPRWHQRLAALLIFLMLRAISVTLRYRWTDRCGLREGKQNGAAIFCLWHNRLASAGTANYYVRKHSRVPGTVAMVSASRDGGMLIAVLELFGMLPVRGSSSRRGAQALRELTTQARKGYHIAITPDGPRGPRYVLQEGIVALAQLTGLPIVPFTAQLQWKISVKSWDRFQIPLPFSRCEMIFDKPLHVPREASVSDREALRAQLEQTMKNISTD